VCQSVRSGFGGCRSLRVDEGPDGGGAVIQHGVRPGHVDEEPCAPFGEVRRHAAEVNGRDVRNRFPWVA